jgi:phosphoketolase
MAEGSMWEAIQHASYYKLDNLIAILDMNRLGQTRETMDGWHGDHYVARAEAFGWNTIQIDGHDPEQIDQAYAQALEQTEAPTRGTQTRLGRDLHHRPYRPARAADLGGRGRGGDPRGLRRGPQGAGWRQGGRRRPRWRGQQLN